MTILTEAELQQIRKRADAATPGPWFVDHRRENQHMNRLVFANSIQTKGVCETDKPCDAPFIAHARQDIPRLLSHIAAMEAELTEYRETILYSEGFLIKDGDKSGWWDSCSSSDAVQAGDALVATGLWERHADGVGRRQFYRRVSA